MMPAETKRTGLVAWRRAAFGAVTALVLSLAGGPAPAQTLTCYVTVASRTTLEAARPLLTEWRERYPEARVVEVGNGRFAVVLGEIARPQTGRIDRLKTEGAIPPDSFCMAPGRVVRLVPDDGSEAPDQRPARRTGRGMFDCPDGYRPLGRDDSVCERIDLPANAVLDKTGNDWTCQRGYLKRGGNCLRITVPENAHLDPIASSLGMGKGWECDRGYREVGDHCERIFIPPNAELNALEDGYECNVGYKDVGQECVLKSRSEMLAELERLNELWLFALANSGKSCSAIEDLCEETCERDFNSYSPSERECLEVCGAMRDRC